MWDNSPMMQRATMAAAVVAAAIAGAFTAYLVTREPARPVLERATLFDDGRPLPAPALVDHLGRDFGLDRLRGRWTLLFFGFTHCPDVCPTTIALFAALRARLPDEALQLLFVSVDPARDTPDRMAAYLAHFGAGLTGATGSDDDIGRFTAGLGLAQVRNPGIAGAYTYDHSAALVLIDPRARVAAYFTPPHDADALAADLAGILGRST
jgi:protein SCO1/2